MGKDIPDRWLNYSPIGQRIGRTRFIAFKVPLRQHVNRSVKPELQLDADKLLESVPNLGMIIDLTNTYRYYSPTAFTERGVAHQKLMIPGKETPSKALSAKFCNYVRGFLKANADNDKLIGVHCTHGVNRTGYLICYFMINMLGMSPAKAIEKFGEARGHSIERENYTESLLRMSQSLPASPTHSPKASSKSKSKHPRDASRSSSFDTNVEYVKGHNNNNTQVWLTESTKSMVTLPPWRIEQQKYWEQRQQKQQQEQQSQGSRFSRQSGHSLRTEEAQPLQQQQLLGYHEPQQSDYQSNYQQSHNPRARSHYQQQESSPSHRPRESASWRPQSSHSQRQQESAQRRYLVPNSYEKRQYYPHPRQRAGQQDRYSWRRDDDLQQ